MSSLFNRPALNAPGANLFSHSGRSYQDIVAEQERKKQAKAERKRLKEEKRKSSEKREIGINPDGESNSKRRRISIEEEDEHDYKNIARTSHTPEPSKISLQPAEVQSSAAAPRRSPRNDKYFNAVSTDIPLKPNKSATVVDLGDSDPEEDVTITAEQPKASTTEEDSDDEFAALARRAREQRQSKELLSKKSQTPDLGANFATYVTEEASIGHAGLPTPPPDPSIQLFITSRLPNTKPLIVCRKLSQNLGDVRKAWCKKQNLSEDQTKDVFLVHRMRRCYDVTTCKSLGLQVDAFGNVTMKGAEDKDDVDKVHLEAVTDEIFQQLKRERAEESQKQANDNVAEEGEGEGAEATQSAEPSLIRLLFKARGLEDLKLKVKPTTAISQIMSAYAKSRGRDVAFLDFDGERLQPHDEVQHTELSDMDCVDVHLR